MQQKINRVARFVTFVMVCCMVFGMIPRRQVQATGGGMNVIYMKESNGSIWSGDDEIVQYTFDLDKGLVLTNSYPYTADIVHTYHTVNTVWSKNCTGINPETGKDTGIPFGHPLETGTEDKDWVYSGVQAEDKESDAVYNVTISQFTYTTDNIYQMLAKLYGNGNIDNLKPDTEYKVYISEIYRLKDRQYRTLKGGRKVIDYEESLKHIYGSPLETLDEIRGAAAKNGFSWSSDTYDAFASFYDIPMSFYISGGSISVVYVDMDAHNKELSRDLRESIAGKENKIQPEPTLTVSGNEYTYQGVYNISYTDTCTLDQKGSLAKVKLGADEHVTVFFGYRKMTTGGGAEIPPSTPELPPDDPPSPDYYTVLIKREPKSTADPSDVTAQVVANVDIYADDYNPTTDALTDVQPYMITDVKKNGLTMAEGAIPSTEQVSLRGRTGAWMYGIALEKVAGSVYAEVNVTVPYDIEITAADGTVTHQKDEFNYKYYVPKNYSYWKVVSTDVYTPKQLMVNNSAILAKSLTVPVEWNSFAPAVPQPKLTSSHRVVDPDPENITTTEIAFSVTEDTLDITDIYLRCGNIAEAFTVLANDVYVQNDKLVIDGVTFLNNPLTKENGNGPSLSAEKTIRDKIPLTDYRQTYESGQELDIRAENATYGSLIRFTYDDKTGTKHQYVSSGDAGVTVNNVTIHTPAVCDGIITVNGTEYGKYSEKNPLTDYGVTADLPIRGVYNPFVVRISNTGLHRLMLGYGLKNFANARSGKKNMDIIESAVRFDFPVYYDLDDNSFKSDGTVDFTDDRYIPANTWIRIHEEEPRFYVLGSIEPGEYTAEFRTVAANCPKYSDGAYMYSRSQKHSNTSTKNYVATDMIKINIHEDFMDFELNGTDDPNAAKQYANGSRALTLDKGYYFNFRTLTAGKAFNDNDTSVNIYPTYAFISANKKVRTDVDLYYSESFGGKSHYFVKYGSTTDNTNMHVYSNRDALVGIDEKLLQYTAKILGDNKLIGKTCNHFVFGRALYSPYEFRMYPELKIKLPNMYCNDCQIVYCSSDARPCSHTSKAIKLFDLDSNEAKMMRQDWYGGLYMPADTYAVTRDTMEGFCSVCGKTRYVTEGRTSCPEHGCALTKMKEFDFDAYAQNHTLTGNEEFFRKDGYIAVNFMISASNSRSSFKKQYLGYYTTEMAKQWKASGIPYVDGDIVLYRLDRSIRDAYEIGGSE